MLSAEALEEAESSAAAEGVPGDVTKCVCVCVCVCACACVCVRACVCVCVSEREAVSGVQSAKKGAKKRAGKKTLRAGVECGGPGGG